MVDPLAEAQVDLEAGTVKVDGQSPAEALSCAIGAAGYAASPGGACH